MFICLNDPYFNTFTKVYICIYVYSENVDELCYYIFTLLIKNRKQFSFVFSLIIFDTYIHITNHL